MGTKLYHLLRKLYHLVQWSRAHFREVHTLRRYFGTEYSRLWSRYDTSVRFHRPDAAALTEEKNRYIKNYLASQFRDIFPVYQAASSPRSDCSTSGTVWAFWWDGAEAAPPIVRAALRSIHKCCGDRFVMLDRHNYQQYIQLPADICGKYEAGIIGPAHFSDILRLSLLARYGGLWIDATVFLSRPIPDEIFDLDFFSCKQADNDPLIPSHYLWAGWILGGSQDFPLFAFARDALICYWRSHDKTIDYLLMDYIFDLAYEHIPVVRDRIDSLPPNNPDRHELMRRLNFPYTPDFFRRSTWFYKLSYRYGMPKAYTSDGARTFYGYLIHEAYLYET